MDWSSIASAAGGLVGSIVGFYANENTNDRNEHNVRLTNIANKEIAKQNNETQVAMQRENNQFAHDEAELAYQRELEKMQMEQRYNSPIEQLRRFQEAGLNPSVAFAGDLSNVVGSNQTAPQASPASSGITPSMPSMIPFQRPMPFNLASGLMDGVVKAATALKTFEESKKTSAEAKAVESQIAASLRKLHADAEGQELSNFILSNYGEKKTQAELLYLAEQAIQASTQSDLNKANKAVAEAQEYLNRESARLHGEQADIEHKKNKTFMETFKASINNLNSQTQKNLEEAKTENVLRDVRKQVLEQDKHVAEQTASKLKEEAFRLSRQNISVGSLSISELHELANMDLQIMREQLKSDHWENTVVGRFLKYVAAPSSHVAAGSWILAK